jgi:preprotein translocase subunit SecA
VAASPAAAPVSAPGLEPHRPHHLQYSAPAEGGGVEHHGESAADQFANVNRNDLCPCGSGRKYKRCHGDPRNAS